MLPRVVMRFKKYIPSPIRRLINHFIGEIDILSRNARNLFIYSPVANTKEAFERFYRQDTFIAKRYLSPSRLRLYEIVSEYCAGILMTSNIISPIRVADIGCGTGHMLDALKCKLSSSYDLELFGLDYASTVINKAESLLPTATFVVEDMYENSFPSDFFDLVLSIETLEHSREPEKAILELLRICKLGGTVVLTVPNGEKDSWKGHVNFWNISQFSELLSPYGLVDIKLFENDGGILARLIRRTSELK